MKKSAFTLIEILLVVAIIGILASMITGSFLSSLRKGRDTKRKADLGSIQKSLELYYEDNGEYPDSLDFAGGQFCHINGCSTRVYMQRLPSDPTTCTYLYTHETSNGEGYQLYAAVENTQDQGPGVLQTGYGQSCGAGDKCLCRFKVSSSNYQ